MDPITTPVPPVQTPNIPQPQQSKPMGPIIGTIVIIVLLVVAAIYILGQKKAQEAPVVPETQTQPTAVIEETAKDEFTDLEANLDSSLEGLDDLNF